MPRTHNIDVHTLLQYIPQHILAQFASETRVNYQVKKLDGELMFKLVLFTLVSTTRTSLRVLEEVFHSARFQHYAGIQTHTTTKHTSLADRLACMDITYFEKLFHHTAELCTRHLTTRDYHRSQPLYRFDSTVVRTAAHLMRIGMVNGQAPQQNDHRFKHVKFTIGFNGLCATSAKVFTEQRYLGEDIALCEAILEHSQNTTGVVVFDRGIKQRSTFTALSQRGIHFVTRINPTTMYDELAPCAVASDPAVIKDSCVNLYAHGVRVTTLLRLIIYRTEQQEEPLYFITNLFEDSPHDIATLYRRRWDIEVFFRFLKQELQLSHLVARNYNGIVIMLYMTLIAAMLIAVYKQLNAIASYRIAKIRFTNELDQELIKLIIVLCNGDPTLLNKQRNPPGFGH